MNSKWIQTNLTEAVLWKIEEDGSKGNSGMEESPMLEIMRKVW